MNTAPAGAYFWNAARALAFTTTATVNGTRVADLLSFLGQFATMHVSQHGCDEARVMGRR